jgi:hypothetical protein
VRSRSLATISPGVGIALGGLMTVAWSPRGAYLIAGLSLTALVAAGVGLGLSAAVRAQPEPPSP